jgi:hypothetical protein
MAHFMPLEEDNETTNSEIQHEIIVLRKKVMTAEQYRIEGSETISIAEAKDRLYRRYK